MYPKYSYPTRLVLKIIFSSLLGRKRSFHLDAQKIISCLNPELVIQGQEFVPAHGPCVITFNHYHRPGFHAWWLALAVAASVELEMHWVVTNELTFPQKWYGSIGRPISRWILKRLAMIYSFTGMPPMPPRPQDAAARAVAVRQVLSQIKQSGKPLLGLAPEGHDKVDGSAGMPARGSGRFGLLLASRGFRFVPVGAFESDGKLCLRFGPGYDLKVPDELSSSEKDQQAAYIMMQNIANLLPPRLRGDFN